jgi:hypothetical protein
MRLIMDVMEPTTIKERTMATTKTETRTSGFVPGVVHLALDVADRGQSTAIAVLQEARAELRAVVEHGIEMAEKVATSGFRFARKVTAKLDEASNDTLANVEKLLGGAVKSARETTRAAQELATTATSSLTGQQTAA